MSLSMLMSALLTTSIFLSVLALGLRTSRDDLRYLLGQPSLLARSLLAMNVFAPLTVAFCLYAFDLHPALKVALMALALAPISSTFPSGIASPERHPYAFSLYMLSSVLAAILTPLAVAIVGVAHDRSVRLPAAAVAQIVTTSVLLPLVLGVILKRVWPVAEKLVPPLDKVSAVLLLVAAVGLTVSSWPALGELVRDGTIAALALIAIAGLVIGHFLGGPNEDERTVLAFATVSRHPGVAIAIASLTQEKLAKAGILLALLVNGLATIPYKQWRKRLHLAAQPTK